jgi:hypothetical protein
MNKHNPKQNNLVAINLEIYFVMLFISISFSGMAM